jgi:hypothetical protein
MNTRYKWSRKDELRALFYFKYPDEFEIDEIANNIPIRSFKMKISNIKCLNNEPHGLSNYSKLCKTIFEEHKDSSKKKLLLELINAS